jgi:hypothetical protein
MGSMLLLKGLQILGRRYPAQADSTSATYQTLNSMM